VFGAIEQVDPSHGHDPNLLWAKAVARDGDFGPGEARISIENKILAKDFGNLYF
jgi:hypothetical protein